MKRLLFIIGVLFPSLAFAQPQFGSAAFYDVGTSGGTICLLNSACSSSGTPSFLGGIILTGSTVKPELVDNNGTQQTLYKACCAGTAYAGQSYNLTFGTSGSPVTLAGANFQLSRTQNMSGVCGNATDAGCDTALSVTTVGIATDNMNANAITGDVSTASTNSPNGNGQGVQGRCDVNGSGTVGCEGGYFLGRSDTSTAAYWHGLEVSSWNNTGVDATDSNGSGILIAARGANNDGAGIYVNGNGSTEWLDGFYFARALSSIVHYGMHHSQRHRFLWAGRTIMELMLTARQ